MDMLWKQRLFRLIFIIVSICFLGIITYFFFFYMYPFVIALFISMLLHPTVTLFESKWKMKRGLTSFMIITLFFCISLLSSYFFIKQIIKELSQLFVMIPSYIENLSILLQHIEHTYIDSFYSYINSLIPLQIPGNFSLTQFIVEKLQANVMNLIQQLIIFSSEMLSSFAYTSLIILFIILATYFITKDYEKIMHIFRSVFPNRLKNLTLNIKRHAIQSIFGLIKTQLMIALLTVLISFGVLLIFRIDHLIIILCLLFIIDLIPYVGIGMLFIPWMLYEFFTDGYILTIQLASLYIILIIVRQMIEPRLLAKNLGIHPLVTIIVLFTSINLFGALGFLITPLSLIVLSSLYHTKIIHYIAQYIKKGTI